MHPKETEEASFQSAIVFLAIKITHTIAKDWPHKMIQAN